MTQTISRRQMLKTTSAGLLTLAAGHSLQRPARAETPQESTLKLYEVEAMLGGCTWYAADSALAAISMHAEPIRAVVSRNRRLIPGQADCWMFRLLIPSTVWSTEDKNWSSIVVVDQEEFIVTEVPPDTILPVHSDEDGKTHLRTASEWASDGPGFVACDDY